MAMGANPARQRFVWERLGVGFVAGAKNGHEQVSRRDGSVLGVMDRNLLPSPVHEHFFSRHMNLAQDRIQGARPELIELAVPAITVAFRMHRPIFFPQQLQRDGFAPELGLNLRPIGQDLAGLPARGRRGHQALHQLRLAQALWQRPIEAGNFRPVEIVTHGAGGQAATAGNFPDR